MQFQVIYNILITIRISFWKVDMTTPSSSIITLAVLDGILITYLSVSLASD